MTTVSGRRMDLHGLVSIARRVSCNVWYINLSSRMVHKWKLKFYSDKNVSQKGPGEFVVNVRQWLPERLRGVFRDQYVVSLLDGGEEGERNYREVGRAAMAGVMRTIHECGLTRDDADEFYAEAAQLVYGQVEGTEATTNKEATPPRSTPPRRAKTATPPRKTPHRRAETNDEPGPKKTRGEEREPLIKKHMVCW